MNATELDRAAGEYAADKFVGNLIASRVPILTSDEMWDDLGVEECVGRNPQGASSAEVTVPAPPVALAQTATDNPPPPLPQPPFPPALDSPPELPAL
jgi:hypothetical protein